MTTPPGHRVSCSPRPTLDDVVEVCLPHGPAAYFHAFERKSLPVPTRFVFPVPGLYSRFVTRLMTETR